MLFTLSDSGWKSIFELLAHTLCLTVLKSECERESVQSVAMYGFEISTQSVHSVLRVWLTV